MSQDNGQLHVETSTFCARLSVKEEKPFRLQDNNNAPRVLEAMQHDHPKGIQLGGRGGGLPYERGRDARRTFGIKPIKETNPGVAQPIFDSQKRPF